MPYNFLVADWTDLLVATFETDKKLLKTYLPQQTELDDWNGRHYMSLVAFMFSNTKFMGIPSPIYRSFEELNLRFYVKQKLRYGWRKGVVFIKEVVPASLIGMVAKYFYRECFVSLPMKHQFSKTSNCIKVEYSFKSKDSFDHMNILTANNAQYPLPGSFESFIVDRYAAYTRTSKGNTLGFHISHRPWKLFPALEFNMQLDAEYLYGQAFTESFSCKPASVFLLDGSRTYVTRPVLIDKTYRVQIKTDNLTAVNHEE